MIAAFEDGTHLHVIKWTGRVRLHAGAVAYCTKTHDAADGVLQIPDEVFNGSAAYVIAPGQKRTPCPACRTAVAASIS